MKRFIECCCTSVYEARQAQEGGASRIELCENLALGGTTPRRELVKEVVAAVDIPVNVLIRPRGGDFVYTDAQIGEMIASIADYKALGINAVVIGALRRDGSVDTEAMLPLLEAARPLEVTFHRAFDCCADPLKSLEDIISLGCERLLTSGCKADALTGSPLIANLIQKACGRIRIMPGCGVRPTNIAQIEASTKAAEFHSSSHGPNGLTDSAVVSELVNGYSL